MSDAAGPTTPRRDSPTTTDGFVRAVSTVIGGPRGRRAAGWSLLNPARVALLTATVVYLLGLVFRLPCRVTVTGQSPDTFKLMCYSDLPVLFQARGLADGNIPYLATGNFPVFEYPVLTGGLVELERRLAVWLGAPVGPGLDSQQLIDATLLFVDVNVVVLGALWLVTVWAQVRSSPHRPWDAMLVAASPCLAATALINWDLLVVALTAAGVLAWARRRPTLAGVLWGLGVAAKLYPLFLLGPLLLLCWRSGRLPAYGRCLGGAVVAWLVTNVPVIIVAPDAWFSFWSFNSDRSGDLGSIWYVLSLAGHPVAGLNRVALGSFVLLCLGIAALIMFAPRRPRVGAVWFLVLAAFLLTNKVYSPQYVLWLLPFVALARPVWRDWLIFTAGELVYFAAIWWHLGGFLAPGSGGADRVYWLAVVIRMATQSWVVIMVVRDVLRPAGDVVRRDGWDDPTGGVLDGTGDVRPWARRAEPATAR